MAETAFAIPTTIPEAVELAADEDTVLLSGGTALAMLVKEGLTQPGRLAWLGRVDELRGVRAEPDGGVRIGAATTLTDLVASPPVTDVHPLLVQAAGAVANPRVRAVATVGGALVHADPRQDLLPALLAADASAHLASTAGTRSVRLRDGFFRGLMDTVVDDGELLTHVTLPPPGDAREAYHRFTPASQDDYPTLSVAARVRTASPSEPSRVAVALGGVASTPMWVDEPSTARPDGGGDTLDEVERLVELIGSQTSPTGDERGSAEYKAEMARVWTRRALRALLDGDR